MRTRRASRRPPVQFERVAEPYMALARESVREFCSARVIREWQCVQMAAHYALSHPLLATIIAAIEDEVRKRGQDGYYTNITFPLNDEEYSETTVKAACVLLAASGYKLVHCETLLLVFWDTDNAFDAFLRGSTREDTDNTYISLSVLDELAHYHIASSMHSFKVAMTCHAFYDRFIQPTVDTNTGQTTIRQMLNSLHTTHMQLWIILKALHWQHLHRGDFRISQSLWSVLEAKRLLADPVHADNPEVGPFVLIAIKREAVQHLACFYHSLGYEVMYPTLGTSGCVHMALNWGPPMPWGHCTLRANTVVLRQSVAPDGHQCICRCLTTTKPAEGSPPWVMAGRAVGAAAARAAQPTWHHTT